MSVALKLIILGFWVCSFTSAQNRECPRSGIILDLDITERLPKPSYSHGETVKVNCVTGYSGMYKYTCKDGDWVKILERKCTRKKCGHPGDALNGDFKLLEGNTEFVFGATVEYYCKKGYELASRINQRTCRGNGWDNAIPTCEVKKCPPIYTKEGVTASGNTEEGSYSDVVHFECESPDKKIDGKSDIHCTENGDWSGPIPTCIEITCTPPNIPHGKVVSMEKHNKDAMLQYKCDPGYKPRQGTPKCTKYGWSLEAECEEITCELKETRFGIDGITPQGKTFFSVGETVQITCSERYRIFLTKVTYKTFKCKPDGTWDSNPVCEEIRCEIPRDPRLSYPNYYFHGELKLDVRRTYYCISGYRPMAREATCTQNGWEPDPLCAEITCEAPNIPNAQFQTPDLIRTQYRVNTEISYKCDPGYEPEQQIRISCNSQGQWSGIRPCTAKTCEAPNIPNAQIQTSDLIRSYVEYKCNPGYEPEQQIRITCNSQGEWSGIRPCTEKKGLCETPTLTNGYIHPDPPTEDIIYYSCNAGYNPFSGSWWGAATCIRGRWSNEPRCIRLEECGAFPSVAHGHWRETNTPDGQSAEITCDPGFKPSHTLIKCINGTWEKPTCELDEQGCVSPPRVENAVIISKPQERYSSGSHGVYTCREGFTMKGNSKVFCHNTNWDKTPTCNAFCPKPLRIVNNAILTNETKDQYSHGDTVHYECADGYESAGETIAKCDTKTWIYPECIEKSQCAKPITNLRFVTLSDEKNLFNNFDILTYKCKEPYNEIPGGTLMCRNKEWNGTFECTSRICPPPPYVEDGDFNIERETADKVITKVSYTCQRSFVLDKPTKRYYQCQNKRWETPPKCLKPCEITDDIRQVYNIQPVLNNYVKHSDRDFTLDCNPGWNAGGGWRSEYLKASCFDGKLQIEKKCE